MIDDDALAGVGQMEQLENLVIGGSREFTGQGLRHLVGLSMLKSIEVRSAPTFHGEGLEHLGQCKSMQEVSLNDCGALGEPLGRLKDLQMLQRLNICLHAYPDSWCPLHRRDDPITSADNQ